MESFQFAAKLAIRRKALGVTQEQLAQYLHIEVEGS